MVISYRELNSTVLEDVYFLHYPRLMSLADRDHITIDKEYIFLYIIDLGKVNNIRPVYFHKNLRVNLGLQVFDGIMRDVFFS